LVTGHPGQTIRDGGEPAVVGVHLTNKGVAGPAVAGLGVAVGGAVVSARERSNEPEATSRMRLLLADAKLPSIERAAVAESRS
jgi:hypothetical protein